MKKTERDENLRLLEKEILWTGDEIAKIKLDLKGEIDELKIEIETIRRLVQRSLPGGEEAYKEIKKSVMREINPEMGSPAAE